MKALVTGIAGFTGHYLAKALTDRDIRVIGIAQGPARVAHVERIHVVDITDAAALREVVLAEAPDLVVHLAAISFVGHRDIAELYRTNILGTRHLLDALTEAKRPEGILLASSSNVYGNRCEGLMREDLAVDPVNDYSVSKVAAELVAGLYRSALPICLARPFNYTGVGQSKDFLIPKIVDHFRRRAPSIKLGNLEVARDFSDVRFVVEAYCRLLTSPAAMGRTVNVSSGTAFRLDEILAKVAEISGHSLEIEIDPSLMRPNEVRQLWGDSSLLDSLIGPIERIPIEATLQWMLEPDR